MSSAERGTRSVEHRRATVLALCFAATVYAGGWWMLHHGAEWLGPEPLPRWPLFFDFLLTVPFVYWLLHRRRPRAWRGALAFAALGLYVGLHLVPEVEGPFAVLIDGLRLAGAVAMAALELWVVVGIVRLLRALGRDENLDYALRDSVVRRYGDQPFAAVFGFELRMWLYALTGARRRWRFRGDEHFAYHAKDGNASNQQGFLVVMLAELVPAHLMLSLFTSATVAWVVTLLTLYSLVLMLAHYRASHRCPISLDADTLYLRYGLRVDELAIPLAAIAHVDTNRAELPRAPGRARLCDAGTPNVLVTLRETIDIPGFYGLKSRADVLALGVDQPARFVAALRARLAAEPVALSPVHGGDSPSK